MLQYKKRQVELFKTVDQFKRVIRKVDLAEHILPSNCNNCTLFLFLKLLSFLGLWVGLYRELYREYRGIIIFCSSLPLRRKLVYCPSGVSE